MTTTSTWEHKKQAPFLPSSEENILNGRADIWRNKFPPARWYPLSCESLQISLHALAGILHFLLRSHHKLLSGVQSALQYQPHFPHLSTVFVDTLVSIGCVSLASMLVQLLTTREGRQELSMKGKEQQSVPLPPLFRRQEGHKSIKSHMAHHWPYYLPWRKHSLLQLYCLFATFRLSYVVMHVPRLPSHKQLELFKSNPDAAPIDFQTAAWPNWVNTFLYISGRKWMSHPIFRACLLF